MDSPDIPRRRLTEEVLELFDIFPVVTLLGPRQCGKTTLARLVAQGEAQAHFFDLENPADQARLADPLLALSGLAGLVVLDEVQRAPGLLEVVRVLADRPQRPSRFLLLGSASPDLVRGASESLAGRTGFVPMTGFSLEEVVPAAQDPAAALRRLWWRGGFPRAWLARSDAAARVWIDAYIQTFLERDIPSLGFSISTPQLRRLWTMIAHYHGQIWNASEIGRSLGESHHTVKRHLDILSGAYVVRQLQPWHENLSKRQVSSPKVYVRDSGVLHALLGIADPAALQGHPKVGASWEGFVIEEILKRTGERDAWFWATQSGAELDLLLTAGGRRIGVEVKYTSAPRLTPSMRVALEDLKLDALWVAVPGEASFPLAEGVRVAGLAEILAAL